MAHEAGQASGLVGTGGALLCRFSFAKPMEGRGFGELRKIPRIMLRGASLSCGELQEVLPWQEIVLPVEPISCIGQFFDYGLTRDEMMFGESQFA